MDLSNKSIAEYVETIFSYGFLQLITRPTRVSGNSATLIDHILTNTALNCHNTFIICSRLSDHFPVIHQINFNKAKTKLKHFESRNFSQENINKFKNLLSNYRWNHVTDLNCTQETTNNFLSTFDALFNAFFPIKTSNFNKSFNPIEPWMSSSLLDIQKSKHFLAKISFKNPNRDAVAEFKTYRNLYNRVIKTAKKLYFKKQLEINKKKSKKNLANSVLLYK